MTANQHAVVSEQDKLVSVSCNVILSSIKEHNISFQSELPGIVYHGLHFVLGSSVTNELAEIEFCAC